MDFAKLRQQHPELSLAWDYLEGWFGTNHHKGFVEPYVLSQGLPLWVDHMKLGRALALMLEAGLLVRSYRAKSDSPLAGYHWENAGDVPEGVVVDFGYSWAASPPPAGKG